ncbi:hypothetical protein ACFZDI_11180 [Streptomyces sp. NPDC007907]|uniref:hypothetical protein n=1 Tax=Streptomyces sp. NPDC007907 TaxID=3364789 RepID=UPI0036E48AF5
MRALLHAGEVEVRLAQGGDVHFLQQIQGVVIQARVLPPLHRLQLVVNLLEDRRVVFARHRVTRELQRDLPLAGQRLVDLHPPDL